MQFGSVIRSMGTMFLGCCFLLGAGAMPAGAGQVDCPESARNLPPIKVIQNGEQRSISLCEAYDFHGNACPGATMTFMAMKYGLELLYGNEVPDLDDLIVVNRAPGGPMDLFDLIMKGSDTAQRTWPPAGMSSGAESFVFQFFRKSNMKTVTLGLKDGLWPGDWFELRAKHRDGTISDKEEEKRQQDRQKVVREFPGKSFTELFGEPQVHTFVAWGHMEPGELDRLMREQRRQAREQKRAER